MFNAVFLDIDGVFNSSEYFKNQKNSKVKDPREWPESTLDPIKIKRFNRVAKLPKTVIVLSSSWRRHDTRENIEEILRRNGAEFRILDVTPILNTTRGEEIAQWLDENPFIKKFAILDDDSDMGDLMPYLVKTSNSTGLEDLHIEKLISILG